MALDLIGEVLVRIVIEVVGYGTGRIIIPMLSFGTARVDKLSARRYLAPSLWWREDGQVVVGGETAAFAGMAFWIAVVVLLCALHG